MSKQYSTQIMEINGRFGGLRKAPRLKDIGRPYGLPPGDLIDVYPVDCLKNAPGDWMRGPGSYCCPVSPDWGLWFDFTTNDQANIAVLPSVKGMNPITGQKLDGLLLEEYRECCPVHKTAFETGLFCAKCNYKWPPQSFVSYPNTLWWDGFRANDGKVRQFFFTAEEERDVASAVIGKQNTVPAFGFAFFSTKTPRAIPISTRGGFGGVLLGSHEPFLTNSKLNDQKFGCSLPMNTVYTSQEVPNHFVDSSSMSFDSSECKEEKTSGGILCSTDKPRGLMASKKMSSPVEICSAKSITRSAITEVYNLEIMKEVSVGAGAEISQDLQIDPLGVSNFKTEPDGIIRLYFVFEERFKQIAKDGFRDINGHKEGYLAKVPVG